MLKKTKYRIVLLCAYLLGFQAIMAQSSVLAEGSWWRFSVSENKIYKVRFQDLGLNEAVNVSKVALFGGFNGAIPLENIAGETFDLQEIAVQMVDANNDGMFGNGDYFLFFGQSPNRWIYNDSKQKYEHQTNVFSKTMSYFLTTTFSGNGKRMENKPSQSADTTAVITNYQEHVLHEQDLVNPHKSSQEWYGEKLDLTTKKVDINLYLPDAQLAQNVDVKARIVVNQPCTVVMSSNSNNNRKDTLSVTQPPGKDVFMLDNVRNFAWTFTSERPRISLEYSSLSSSYWAYLDYIELHYRRALSLANSSIVFRFADFESAKTADFRVVSANSSSQIWDVSDALNPKKVQGNLSGTTFSFASQLSKSIEFIGFSDNHIQTITTFEKVENQNLHGKESVDYVMVVHPDFLSEAERLAEFHRHRNLNVLVVTPTQVFNEFSYGRQDPMAIRRMMRHYYRKAQSAGNTALPKYLLLFGSPSYDYLNRDEKTKGYVLNYQYPNGLIQGQSLSTDDFFGFLQDGQTGLSQSDTLSIGIGRFPARTLEQARILVTKTIDYATPTPRTFGDWKNVVTNLSDDGVSEPFTDIYESTFKMNYSSLFKEINVEKIYSDAFPQVATPSGARYPAAKEALKQRIERGTLILNYEGHSGPVSLADEVLMNISDIQNFGNFDQLTLFFTASCEFSRYDDPSVTSGGEQSVLSPRGMAVAQIGASRVAYTQPNADYHATFNRIALTRNNDGSAKTFGEMMKLAKNAMKNNASLQPFILLGDPAIPLALPKYQIVTDSINGTSVAETIDTIKALDKVSLSGRITDFNQQLLSDFSGEIIIAVYDKPVQTRTLGNPNSTRSGDNPVDTFEIQKNILYKGRVLVTNGHFRVEFMTPKELNYAYGFGKISYYAFSETADATGVFDEIIIGGYGDNFELVADAPTLQLTLLDDTIPRSGNIPTTDPILLAEIGDKYGINHSGGGIGHNIALTMNDDFRNQIYLNDYFEYLTPKLGDSMIRGEVRYPMFNLEPGKYKLHLRVSNIFNVSTESDLSFQVVGTDAPIIESVYNYPNPMRDETTFYFTHNAPKKIKRVDIDIFDLSGKIVGHLTQNLDPNGFVITPIRWNGRDSGGNSMPKGLYTYLIRITLEDGETAQKAGKLVISI